MKIMHFAGGGDVGGAKTHILSLGAELARTNDFQLISFRRSTFSEEAKEKGLDVIEVENAWNLISCLRTALHAVDSFKPDIIHCHGAKANMLGVVVHKMRHVPICTTVHSDPSLDYMGTPLKQISFGTINSWALRRMDYYMAVAGRMENSLIRRGLDPQKIYVIHNGLDFSEAAEQAKPHQDGAPIVVGIAARLTPIKNIPVLLRAFAKALRKNPNLQLKIAGTGEDEAELKKLAAELGIAEKTHFVGWVSDMSSFFREIDINVICSFSETFPYSLLEGAYDHCTAVASNVGGIPELIEDGVTGLLFEPEQEDKLAELIYQLSVDDALRELLAENLFQKAKNEFSLNNMRQTQEDAYRLMLKRSCRKSRWGTVICGAYGRGNAGDEAILQAIVSQMRGIDKDMPLTVLSRDKLDTRQKNKTNAIYIFNVPSFIKHLKRSQIFINGGGSLIQDVTSSRSLYFYLFTLWAARLCGCRVIMYGCGIGPIKKGRNQKIAARILNRNVEIITLRDSNSVQVLAEIGVKKPIIRLSADPTVNLGKSPKRSVEAAFAAENVPADAAKIGFCLRNWPEFTNPEAVAAAADYAYQHYGLLPVFIPIELPKDIEAASHVTSLMSSPYYACNNRHSVEELIGMLGSMQVVVGMRLHSLIFATSGGAPVIGISYDVKVDSFIHDIGSQACVPLPELSLERLQAEIDKIAATDFARADAATERLRQGEEINISSVSELLSTFVG